MPCRRTLVPRDASDGKRYVSKRKQSMYPKPLLIIVSGVPGAGKTQFAKEISIRYDLPLISNEDIKEVIAVPLKVNTIGLSGEIGKISFGLLWRYTEEILKDGMSCIIETRFYPKESVCEIQRILDVVDTDVLEVIFEADFEVVRERYQARNGIGHITWLLE